jgi:DNA-directed primase/polymerase protein
MSDIPAVVPALQFYGVSRRFVPPVLRHSRAARKAVLDSKRACDPSREKLVTFPLQRQAFDYADSNPGKPALHVWAFEIDGSGRRRYICASVFAFWRWYRVAIRRQSCLHVYEVIRRGSACKAYFDLEFRRLGAATQELDGDGMTDCVVDAVSTVLANWDRTARGTRTDVGEVVRLNSSTAAKYSVHLIFPSIVFENNFIAGLFASEVSKCLPSHVVHGFVDLSVYTQNRCFRLIGSSKFGKEVRLTPSTVPSAPSSRISFGERLFFQSLVCIVNGDVYGRIGGVLPQGVTSPSLAQAPALTLPPLKDNLLTSFSLPSSFSMNTLRHSPPEFANVDAYVLTMVKPYGGDVASISYFPASSTLSYTLRGNYRYCARIGRHHRSNNVILVVSVESRSMYQRCFDPDCRDYRSPSWDLPDGLFHVEDDDNMCDDGEENGCDAACDGENRKFNELLNALMDEFEDKNGGREGDLA